MISSTSHRSLGRIKPNDRTFFLLVLFLSVCIDRPPPSFLVPFLPSNSYNRTSTAAPSFRSLQPVLKYILSLTLSYTYFTSGPRGLKWLSRCHVSLSTYNSIQVAFSALLFFSFHTFITLSPQLSFRTYTNLQPGPCQLHSSIV